MDQDVRLLITMVGMDQGVRLPLKTRRNIPLLLLTNRRSVLRVRGLSQPLAITQEWLIRSYQVIADK